MRSICLPIAGAAMAVQFAEAIRGEGLRRKFNVLKSPEQEGSFPSEFVEEEALLQEEKPHRSLLGKALFGMKSHAKTDFPVGKRPPRNLFGFDVANFELILSVRGRGGAGKEGRSVVLGLRLRACARKMKIWARTTCRVSVLTESFFFG